MAQPLHDNLWGFQMTAPLSSDLQEILSKSTHKRFNFKCMHCKDVGTGIGICNPVVIENLEALIQSRERALLERMLEVGDEKDNYATRVLNNINEALATLSNNEEL